MKTLKASIFFVAIISSLSIDVYAAGAADAAKQAAQSALSVMAVSAAAGGKFAITCAHPGGQVACGLAALSFAQVFTGGQAKSGADKSYSDLTSTTVPAAIDSQPTVYTLSDGSTISGKDAQSANALAANGLGGLANDMAKGVQAVSASGTAVSADGASVTMSNGKSVPASAFASSQGMKDAGFSASDIQAANGAIAAAGKATAAAQSKIASLTNDAGGGGGGGDLSKGAGAGGSFDPYGKLGNAKSKDANVSGMSKKLGNDNIGVAGDDLFQMLSRRYQSRDKASSFLKN